MVCWCCPPLFTNNVLATKTSASYDNQPQTLTTPYPSPCDHLLFFLKTIALLSSRFPYAQNFTAGQTIAFRDTARSVFEAAIVRGELDFNEAYQVFTNWMLSLSGATAPQETAQQHPTPWSIAGGIRPSQEGASTSEDDEHTPPASGAASATKRTLDSSGKVAKQEALTEKSNKKPKRWSRGIDAVAPNAGAESTADPRERKYGNRSGESPRFSVREIVNMTDFVARVLFRNFALYRMYFKQPARRSQAVKNIRVATPLAPLPLRESEQDP